MDVEKLEKLNELKEKGVITQEEFNAMKQQILIGNENNIDTKIKSNKNKGVNWKNSGISFLISVGIYSIAYIILCILEEFYICPEEYLRGVGIGMNLAIAGIFQELAKKHKTHLYKKCDSPSLMFIMVLFFGPIGVWAATYEFLQIKQGNAILKDKK